MILLKPLRTEKAIKLLEFEKTLTLKVDDRSNKEDIKREVEKLLNVKVEKVRVVNTFKDGKHAYVKLSKDTKVDDIISKLKMM